MASRHHDFATPGGRTGANGGTGCHGCHDCHAQDEHVDANGSADGTASTLTQLRLPEGQHTVTERNPDFPACTTLIPPRFW